MNVSHGTDGRKPAEISQILTQLGFGWAQVKLLLVAGAVWACDGGPLLVMGAVMNSLTTEWELTAVERGLLVSLVFVGVILGNLFGGPIADHMGRRVPLLISFAGVFIFSLASAFAWDFTSMAWFRVFIGISLSLGQPAFNALCTECVPPKYRLHMMVGAYSLFALGEIYSASLLYNDDMYLQNLHWRRMVFLSGIPAGIFFFVSLVFLEESPFFLAMTGETERAEKVLDTIRRDNGAPASFDTRFAPLPPNESGANVGMIEKFQHIFSRRMWFTTLVASGSCFTLNFLFYGSLYAYPQFLPASGDTAVPAATLVWASISELPGYAAGLILGMYVTRKFSMQVFCLSSFLMTMLLAIVVKTAVGLEVVPYSIGLLLRTAINCNKLFTTMGFCIVLLYSVEAFSVRVRATGTGFCMAFGRLGAISSPIIYEIFTSLDDGNPFHFFCFIAMLCLVNYVLLFFMAAETADESLKCGASDETRPLNA